MTPASDFDIPQYEFIKNTNLEVAMGLRSFPTMFEFHTMLKRMCVTPCSVATRHCVLRDYYVADLWLAAVCPNHTIPYYTIHNGVWEVSLLFVRTLVYYV